ncbi:dihydrodipicolinate synthase family protein [Fusobacterium sp.]|uniref:dihydrodipicolinate synthase family protein n=1 Tax=Fusobacterium TaxID=848 RepID=UPI0025BB22FC|nr:dihydrodipicolinate synthase family protein [Fusobacterium sp.]MCI5725594.1 dihydrodipicolinate synthase family protein [Fusobacterium sp.]MCI7223371.1 dihydrodipicolinate synthase family protein [Fusobacterium sp.]MDD7391248.1 dihydrodipicolinate synthase family protein [Fusobacteriaceae bacterium]MDY5795842.1 dihydrodipicolinate synthase family protein [Fusobacterium gastrosuis]
MDLSLLKGIYVPILTPVKNNEEVDVDKLREHVNYIIEKGVHGILAHGSNGEFYMFDDDDYELITRVIVEETRGRVPVLMGIGAIRTSKAIKLAKMGERLGVDGISLLQPMFLKPTDEELFLYFKEIADSVPNLPVLLYNNPRVGYTMSGDLVEKLAREVKNMKGMKDSSGDINQLMEFIRRTRDLEFKVFGGKDTMIYAALAVGAVGSVCSTANMFPEIVTAIYNEYANGNIKESLELQYRFNPVRIAQDKASFPVATKDMANIMGLNVGKPIKPNLPSKESLVEFFKQKIEEAELLKR